MKVRMSRIVAGLVAWTGSLFLGSFMQFAVAQDTANLPYMNTNLSAEQRATDLVHRMTLAEKASQMLNRSSAVQRLRQRPPLTNGGVKPSTESSILA